MRLILNGAFLRVITVSLSKVAILESNDIRCCSSRPDTLNSIVVLSGITNGLTLRLCGAMGVRIKLEV